MQVYWNSIEDTHAKGQVGQSQPFWNSHEAGYKTRGRKESPFFCYCLQF